MFSSSASFNLINKSEKRTNLTFTDWNGAEKFINTDEVAVIEMPLVGVERKIVESIEEWGEEID